MVEKSERGAEATTSTGTKRWRTVLLGFVALVILLGLAALALYVVTHEFGVKWSVISTAVGALIAWIVRADIEKRREYEKLLNQQKRDQYAKFIDVMNKFLPITDEPREPPRLSELREWSMKLMLIGSDDVLKSWNAARRPSVDGRETTRAYVRLLLAMRRDSGHHHTKLRPSDMLSSFVNDLGPNDLTFLNTKETIGPT